MSWAHIAPPSMVIWTGGKAIEINNGLCEEISHSAMLEENAVLIKGHDNG